jgi:membrane-associated phospholipid phosphatase
MPKSRTPKSRTDDDQRATRALALALTAGAAAAAFGLLAAAVARRDTARADHAARKRTAPRRGNPVRRGAKAIAPAGKWWTYVPGALAASLYLLKAESQGDEDRRSRRSGAGAVFLTGVVATALNPAFDHWLPQPPTPPGHRKRGKAVFPSGHAFGPAAVSLAAAYVLSRERLARPAVAFPTALAIPAVTAGARMLQEKHWASDVLGGYLGGVAVAAGCLAAYEAARAR